MGNVHNARWRAMHDLAARRVAELSGDEKTFILMEHYLETYYRDMTDEELLVELYPEQKTSEADHGLSK